METSGAIVENALSPGSILIHSLGEGVGSVAVQLSSGPMSDQILSCLVTHIRDIRLQLLCGVRIELA